MKSISKLSLIFLSMALCFSPKSYANEAEEANSNKTGSNLKTGENIILTEPDSEVDTIIKDLNESTEKIQDKVETEEKASADSKDNPEKREDKNTTNSVTTSKPLKNPNTKENSKESKENSSSSTLEISPAPNNISRQTSSNKDVDELMAEIKIFLKKNKEREQNRNSADSSKKDDDIKRKVEKVSDVVVSNKISKEESEKIAKSTKDIVKEYNKKIEATNSYARKQELAQEAIDKINQNVKLTSKEAYDYINKKDDEVTLFDQKNETLVLEIDAPGSSGNDNNSNDEVKDLDQKDLIRGESSSLSRSPKLSNKKDSKKAALPIILGIILVIGISVALSLALKVRENKNITSKN